MDAATTAVTLAMILLVACHALTLHLVRKDRDGVRLYAGALGDAIATIADSVQEGGRIGADVADAMDRIESALAGSGQMPQTVPQGGLDIRGTLASLLTSHLARQFNATQEQEWTIYEDDPSSPPNIIDITPETQTQQTETEPDEHSS